jgi:hypothetical protein
MIIDKKDSKLIGFSCGLWCSLEQDQDDFLVELAAIYSTE